MIEIDGVKFDYENEMAKNLTKHATRQGIENCICFYTTHPNGYKSYLLTQNQIPIFESQKYEDVAVHIDIMVLDKKFNHD